MSLELARPISTLAAIFVALSLAGCVTIAEKTNVLSDSKLVEQSAHALGYSPADLVLVSRTADGANTNVQLNAKDGKQFHCLINGGNLLTMGLTNPPMCAAMGQPIDTRLPFGAH